MDADADCHALVLPMSVHFAVGKQTTMHGHGSEPSDRCPGQSGPEDEEDYAAGYVKIAIENDPIEIVDFPMKNGDVP